MFTRKILGGLAIVVILYAGAIAFGRAATTSPTGDVLQFGQPATSADIAAWNIDVPPNGAGLPPGAATAVQGAKVYATHCAVCHGADLQGMKVPGRSGFPALAGGQGSLTSDHPKKTVGSFWPYSTTLFDYIRRAMPFDRPQTLTNDEVYAVTAYILAQNHIIAQNETMNARTLPKVRMPNRNGFYPNETEGGLNTIK